ncbi:MAG: helix-turn-helix domain-containing protein [Thermoplasmatota archaeon]
MQKNSTTVIRYNVIIDPVIKIKKKIQNICCQEVLSCVFNLNNLDFTVYNTLKETGEIRADNLAQLLHKERSTIYRSLQKLTSCGLCKKTIKTIPSGGYFHTYTCTDPKQIKKEIETCIDNWYMHMKQKLKTIEQELR